MKTVRMYEDDRQKMYDCPFDITEEQLKVYLTFS